MASLVLSIECKDGATPKIKALQETVVRAGSSMKNSGAHAVTSGRQIDRLGSLAQSATSRLRSLVVGYVAAGAAAVAAAFSVRRVITETIEADRASAQLEARLRSTGGAVGYTHAELTKMASGLQAVTTYGDEAIITAETLLLQFRQIGHDVFPDALKATLDIATAMGSDLPTAAKMLGKALNDPVGGLTALRRAGLQFTEGQRDQIKYFAETNRVADAQRLILGELEKQIGGAAIAARGTLGGALEGLKNSFGDLFEAGNTGDAVASINALNESLQTESVQHYAKVFRDSIMNIIASMQYIGPTLDQIEIEWSNFWLKLSIWAENYKNQIINNQEDLGRDLKRIWADLKSTDLFSVSNLFGSDPLGGKIPMFAPETSSDVWTKSEAEKIARAAASAERIKQMTKEADQAVMEAMERRGASLAKIHAAGRAAGAQIAGLNGEMGDGAQDVAGYDNELSRLADTLSELQASASIMRELNTLRVRAGEMSDAAADAADLGMQRQILEASMAKAQYEASAAKEADDRAKATQEVLNLSKQIMALPEIERLNQKIQANRVLEAQREAELGLVRAQAQSAMELSRLQIDAADSEPGFTSAAQRTAIAQARIAAIKQEYDYKRLELDQSEKSLRTELESTRNQEERVKLQSELGALQIESNSLGEKMAYEILAAQNDAIRDLRSNWAAYTDDLKGDLEDMSSIAVTTAESATSSFGSFFTDLVTQEQSAKDSWLDFVKSVRDSFLNAVGEMIAKKALLSVATTLGFGGSLGDASSLAATNLNTSATTANTAAIAALTGAMGGSAITGAASGGAASSAAGALIGESGESASIMSGIWSGVKRFGTMLINGFSAIATFFGGVFSSIGSGLMSGLGSLGGFALTGLTSLFALLATGGVFMSGGNLSAFAQGAAFTNSIVTRPTYFAMANGAGLMGEAGPEAVMLLTRLPGGRLGVSASGSGGADFNRLIAALERNQTKPEKTEIVIYNLIDSEALLAPIASDAGKQIITNHIGADFNENGPIRRIVQGK